MRILSKEEASIHLMNNIPKAIKDISNALNNNGFDCFVVGGCVRDSFLKEIPKDFDLATNAMPSEVIDSLKKAKIKCEERGVEFGVVVAKVKGEEFEIATFRSDISAGTGNLMDDNVKLGVSIEDDVKRRDLTINSLFLNIKTGEIIDLVNGIEDLKNNIIRTVGDPFERFREDSTRKLRVFRFASRYGFSIDEETFSAIRKDPSLHCNKERTMMELEKIFSDRNIDMNKTFLMMVSCGLLQEAFKGCKFNTNLFKSDVISISTMIASLVSKDTDKNLFSTIVMDKNIVRNVNLLWKLNVENVLDNVSIYGVHRLLQSCNLTKKEARIFCDDFNVNSFFSKQIPELIRTFNKEAIDNGLEGKRIREFTERELQLFYKLLTI